MNPYSTDKIIYWPELVERFKNQASHKGFPVFIHLMPQNKCNQNCSFCAYRHCGKDFDAVSTMPMPRMRELLSEFKHIGVKAIEITGGGEPMLHPNIDEIVEESYAHGMKLALITNGSLMTSIQCYEYPKMLTWMRISVDAGTEETYREIRKSNDWERVWETIHLLAVEKRHMTLGLGFVVNDQNYAETYQFCKMAARAGVDNVRIAVAFTPKGRSLINKKMYRRVYQDMSRAKKDFRNLQIADLFEERLDNMENYPSCDYCGVKDLICVVTGEGNVHTCCTLVGQEQGLIGNILNQSFTTLWNSKVDWRRDFCVQKNCQCTCLYNARNEVIEGLRNPPGHLEFI